jgi:hypothetical protein
VQPETGVQTPCWGGWSFSLIRGGTGRTPEAESASFGQTELSCLKTLAAPENAPEHPEPSTSQFCSLKQDTRRSCYDEGNYQEGDQEGHQEAARDTRPPRPPDQGQEAARKKQQGSRGNSTEAAKKAARKHQGSSKKAAKRQKQGKSSREAAREAARRQQGSSKGPGSSKTEAAGKQQGNSKEATRKALAKLLQAL